MNLFPETHMTSIGFQTAYSQYSKTKVIFSFFVCSIVPHRHDCNELFWIPHRVTDKKTLLLQRRTDFCIKYNNLIPYSKRRMEIILHGSDRSGLPSSQFWTGYWCSVTSLLIGLKHNADCLRWSEAEGNPFIELQWTMASLLPEHGGRHWVMHTRGMGGGNWINITTSQPLKGLLKSTNGFNPLLDLYALPSAGCFQMANSRFNPSAWVILQRHLDRKKLIPSIMKDISSMLYIV